MLHTITIDSKDPTKCAMLLKFLAEYNQQTLPQPRITLDDYCDAWQQCYPKSVALALNAIEIHCVDKNVNDTDGITVKYDDIKKSHYGHYNKINNRIIGGLVAIATKTSHSIGDFAVMQTVKINGVSFLHIDAQSVVALRMSLMSGNKYCDYAKQMYNKLIKAYGIREAYENFVGKVPTVAQSQIVSFGSTFEETPVICTPPPKLRNGIIVLGETRH